MISRAFRVGFAGILLASAGLTPPHVLADSTFVRGDFDGDGAVDCDDLCLVTGYLAGLVDPPACLDASDVSDDGTLDWNDPVSLARGLFCPFFTIPAPYPECGGDETADPLPCAESLACGGVFGWIGPAGGEVSVEDPESPLFGVSVFLAPGSVSTEAFIGIEEGTLDLADISPKLEVEAVGPAVSIRCSEELLLPATIRLPYPDDDDDGLVDGLDIEEGGLQLAWADDSGATELPTRGFEVKPDENVMEVTTRHFSVWLPWYGRWKYNSEIYYEIESRPTNALYPDAADFDDELVSTALAAWQPELEKVGIRFVPAEPGGDVDITFQTADLCDLRLRAVEDCEDTDAVTRPRIDLLPPRFWFEVSWNIRPPANWRDRLWIARPTDFPVWPPDVTGVPHPEGLQWDPVAFPFVAMHEVGHALFLKHTHETITVPSDANCRSIMKDGGHPDLYHDPALQPVDVYLIRKKYGIPIVDEDEDYIPDELDNCPPSLGGGSTSNLCQGDQDQDGWGDECDCGSDDPTVYPGAPEVCGDGLDNDCDGAVDEDCPPPPTTELVASYQLDGNPDDSSGNAHHGTLAGGTWVTVGSKPGGANQAIYLSGSSSEYIEVPHDEDLNFGTEDFTISAWVRTDSMSYYQEVVNKFAGDAVGERGYIVNVSQGFARFYVASMGYVGVRSTDIVSDNEWHHLAVVRGEGTISLFIDGVLDSSVDDVMSTGGQPVCSSSGPLWIGAERAGVGTYTYRGYIDEVQLHRGAMDAGEVSALHGEQSAFFD